MTDALETEALRYLLNEMDAGGRIAFEERLEREPAACAALKACADAVARFACERAPAEGMSAADQKAALAAILGSASVAESATRTAQDATARWARFFWPIAAAALLAINLIDFDRPLATPRGDRLVTEREKAAGRIDDPAGKMNAADSAMAANGIEDGGQEDGAVAKQGERATVATAELVADLAEASRELAKLRADYVDLQRATSALRADYDGMLQHWMARLALDRTVGRLAAMELVDAESYARGDRKGLVEVARGILTEPGVIVAVDGPETPGVDPSAVAGDLQPAVPVSAPYAWAVFDEKEQRGYLNLYNLPAVAGDEALQLWVRPVDTTEYRRVGEVPAAFYGGAGSVQYRMSEGAAPAEILITRESRNTLMEQPAGPTVLRGP